MIALALSAVLVITAQCDGGTVFDTSTPLTVPVRAAGGSTTVLEFQRPVRGVTLSAPTLLAKPATLDGHRVSLSLKSAGDVDRSELMFDFDEGVRIGPLTVVRSAPAACVVHVYVPSWARQAGLEAELDESRRELALLRTAPAVATIGRALLAQPKDRPTMFRVETRRVTARTTAGDVTADAVVAYWLFDVTYLVVRLTANSPWLFGRATASGARVVGTFIEAPEVEARQPREVVIALVRPDRPSASVTVRLLDVSGQRPIVLPPLDL